MATYYRDALGLPALTDAALYGNRTRDLEWHVSYGQRLPGYEMFHIAVVMTVGGEVVAVAGPYASDFVAERAAKDWDGPVRYERRQHECGVRDYAIATRGIQSLGVAWGVGRITHQLPEDVLADYTRGLPGVESPDFAGRAAEWLAVREAAALYRADFPRYTQIRAGGREIVQYLHTGGGWGVTTTRDRTPADGDALSEHVDARHPVPEVDD